MNSTKSNVLKSNSSKSNSTNTSLRSNTTPVSKSLLQNYSTTTVIYIIGFLSVALAIIYLYHFYKTLKNKISATQANISTDCPDYWESSGNGKCKNVNLLGSCATSVDSSTVDFSGELFTNNNTGNYAKCMWAKACSMPWSGIERLC
jgi:hypothetical protein